MPIISPGPIKKMTTQLSATVEYQLPIADQTVPMNALIGQEISLNYNGTITCSNCARKTRKSYAQGFCYPCMIKLAQCDMCIMKPETCHYDKGTCREPEWADNFCMVPHYVYLANTSGLKVGITRHSQIPTRWIDQGATQALPIFMVNTRLQSGLVEIALAKFIADKTNWRAMLKGSADPIDLVEQANIIRPKIEANLEQIKLKHGTDAVQLLNEEVVNISYPVEHYLTKITALNFDKTPEIQGTLIGIKGQYLIFEHGVLNMRKFTSYHIGMSY